MSYCKGDLVFVEMENGEILHGRVIQAKLVDVDLLKYKYAIVVFRKFTCSLIETEDEDRIQLIESANNPERVRTLEKVLNYRYELRYELLRLKVERMERELEEPRQNHPLVTIQNFFERITLYISKKITKMLQYFRGAIWNLKQKSEETK